MHHRTVQGLRKPVIKVKDILAQAIPAENLKRGDYVTGKVYNVTDDGVFMITPENYIGFFHKSEVTQELKLEDRVEGRVTFVREDGRINLSMRPAKEVGRLTDAEKILEFLKKRGGEMPYSDASTPEIIKEKFNLSKGSFKRALGKLLKDGVIIQEQGWTRLKSD